MHTQVQAKSRVQAQSAAVFDYVGHGPEGALVLIARSHGPALLTTPCPLGQQHRHLRTELGELERTGDEGEDGAGRGTGRAETSYRVQIRISAGLVDVAEDVVSRILLRPAGIDVLGPLVDGE